MPSCDRCLEPTPATDEQVIALNATRYRLHLCDKHADLLQRDFFAWSRVGDLLDDERPLRALAAPVGGELLASYVAIPKAVCAPPVTVEGSTETWDWSQHALGRADLRRISREAVAQAVRAPHRIEPGHEPGEQVRWRGDLAAVVDITKHTILTVYRKESFA